jgi:hypothetical protein
MVWMDFRQCQWPPSIVSHADFINVENNSTALASLFASINDLFLPARADGEAEDTVKRSDNSLFPAPPHKDKRSTPAQEDIIISFSHFVPRIELIPERRFLLEPSLARVSGSDFLEAQIRHLKPDLHIVSRHVL